MDRGRDIIPSHMGLAETPRWDDGGVFDDVRLRYGEVQEILYPDDEKNRSKKFVEYNVFVQYRDGGVGTGVIYTNVLLADGLGSLADSTHFTLRAPETPSIKDKQDYGLGLGSKVLIACLNGERSNAYIISGKRDPTDDRDKKAKDLGHHFSWIFNGISAFINKDGEAELLYRGKTNIDGKVNKDVDSNAPNSKIQFLKNGNINLGTRENKQQVLLDNENGKVIIQRDKFLEIGDATDKMLLGETFRTNHKQMHDEMKQQFTIAKNLLQQAAIQLNTAGGSIAGPFLSAAAGSNLIAASQLLVQVSNVMGQLSQAIDDFEVNGEEKNSYLSKKNKSD